MMLAIEEARKGLGHVAPNPPVGCVILDSQNELLAKGYHRRFGGAHAEVDALEQLANKDELKGATLYVTLEPCAHEGKTPSCAKALAKLPLKKVVYGLFDPNPLVAGKGVEILKNAGIAVEEFSDLKEELTELAEIFLWNHQKKLPYVALKVATSLDGQLAHISGQSQWITGEESRKHTHYLRANYDAIVIGKNTFLKDNPSLDIRHPQFVGKKNKVIVLDVDGQALERIDQSKIYSTHAAENIFWAVGRDQFKQSTCSTNLLRCDLSAEGNIDLPSLLREAYKSDIHSLLVEGGAQVLSSFLSGGYAQRFYQFIAPKIIGGQSGLNYAAGVSCTNLPDARQLKRVRYHQLGSDILVSGLW